MRRLSGPLGLLAAAAVALAACSLSASTAPSPAPCPSAATATGAQGCGGMARLIAEARAEGTLNVIGLPRDWVGYGALLDGFHARYGIRVVSYDANGKSEEEIATARRLGRGASAPDVLDLRTEVAEANGNLFAPYEVATWTDIPDVQKDPTGLWTQDYGGFMAIGYDSSKVPPIASVDDLLLPAFRGKVALKGDPARVDSSLGAVMMVNLAESGSLTNVAAGVDYFHRLKVAGNLIRGVATEGTVKSGATPVVFDWEYLSAAHVNDVPTWKVFVPQYPTLGSYFAQAINKNAPHPAAARLWEEYVYSDEGQNLWLRGGARPVRLPAMLRSGTVESLDNPVLPYVEGTPIMMTAGQVTAARSYLTAHWNAAVA